MKIIIISYRQEWRRACTRSCNCYEGSNYSAFEILGPFDCAETAAERLAKHIDLDRHADYINLISLDGKNLNAFTDFCQSAAQLHNSIFVPCDYGCDENGLDYDNTEFENLEVTLRDLTKKNLDALEEAKEKTEREKKAKIAAAEAEAKKQQELKELERLRSKYGK